MLALPLNQLQSAWLRNELHIIKRTTFKQAIQRVLKNINIHVTHYHNHDRDNSSPQEVPLYHSEVKSLLQYARPDPSNQGSVFHHSGSALSGFHVKRITPYVLLCLASIPLHNILQTNPHCFVSVVHSFLLLSSFPLYEWISICGHLGCFQFWAIMNKVAINALVQAFMRTYAFISFE